MTRRPLLLVTLTIVAGCGDIAVVPQNDMANAVTPDLAMITSPGDMAKTVDLAQTPPDLTNPPDLAKSDSVVVFLDDYGPGVSFAPFGGSTNDLKIDVAEHHSGTASLKINVPMAGYTGGAMKAGALTDLSKWNALSFWAKSSKPGAFDTFGLGNDANAAKFSAEEHAVMITGTWTKYYVPLADPAKLTAEDGLFHFAQGGNGPYSVWLDDIQYEKLDAGTLGVATAAIATETLNKSVGDAVDVNGVQGVWMTGGVAETVSLSRSYFGWTSSMPLVASVDANGHVTALAPGTADITAKLGTVDAAGKTTIKVSAAMAPNAAPARPALAAGNVISMLSNAYTNVPVDTWITNWSSATETDVKIGGDDMKKYTNLVFAGTETVAKPIDATTMTAFHIDLWTPDSTQIRIKLVDFGKDGAFGGGDDVEHELTFDANSNPKLVTSAWIAFEMPLANFVNLTTRAHIAQLIISGSTSTAYVDNVYFHK